MTREHKIALIIGFSLILVVAILISDHLSRARRTRVDQVQPTEVLLAEGSLIPADPLAPVSPLTAAPTNAAPPNAAPAATQHQVGPAGAASAPSSPVGGPLAGPIPGATPLRGGNDPGLGGNDPSDAALRADIAARGGAIVPGDVPTIVLPTTNLGTSATNPAATAPPVEPLPKVQDPIRYHAVQKGDNLYRLAEKYYGSGSQWKLLADANKDRVGANNTLREGTRLRIPAGAPAAFTKQSPATAPKPESKKDTRPAAPKADETRIAKARTYTVQKNDTLGEISRRALGTSRRWPEIAQLNGLDEEDLLTPGMVLRLPGT